MEKAVSRLSVRLSILGVGLTRVLIRLIALWLIRKRPIGGRSTQVVVFADLISKPLVVLGLVARLILARLLARRAHALIVIQFLVCHVTRSSWGHQSQAHASCRSRPVGYRHSHLARSAPDGPVH